MGRILNRCAAALFLCIAPMGAKAACYAPEELRAEQLLRLHSEMMVVAATCRQASDGSDLAFAYKAFTRKNLRALRAAEKTMMNYYKKTEGGDPVEGLDRLRTKLGNEAGQTAADLTPPEFCARYRDNLEAFGVATSSALDRQVRRMASAEASFERPCDEGESEP